MNGSTQSTYYLATWRRRVPTMTIRVAVLTIGIVGYGYSSASPLSAPPGKAQPQSSMQANSSASSLLQEAVLAKGLTANQEPINRSNVFFPTETVCLSLKLKGRPSKGIAFARFYLGDQLISEARVDVATVNRGVVVSIGESTFTGFALRPNHPFPISDKYRVEAFFDAKPIGTYKFRIAPPADAIPSKITVATLAKGVDAKRAPVEPTTQFTSQQPVYLAARGDIGIDTGIEVNWYINGKLDKKGTRSITASKNALDTRFYFSFLPAGGWEKGKHEAALIMNGNEVGRYVFTIK